MAEAAKALPLAVSMGEPAGIGTEVLLRSYNRLKPLDGAPPFFLIDDPVRVGRIMRAARVPFPLVSIEKAADAAAAFAEGLPVLPLTDVGTIADVEPGKPSAATAGAVIRSIEMAVSLSLRGEAGGVVTLPIQKSVLQEAGFKHPGHTEFLGALTEEAPMPNNGPRGPLMMLAAGGFRTIPVTVHQALGSVPESLNADLILKTGLIAAHSLSQDFGLASPRLAVAGLNPHAGEDGRMGTEERDVIAPAVKALQAHNVAATGPWPADTMFHEEARAQYDVALAMYHDQALVPIKTVAFHEAVNVTLGLPIIRTSPDHGTGLAIAGRGVARPDSTMAAILMAAHMAGVRARRA